MIHMEILYIPKFVCFQFFLKHPFTLRWYVKVCRIHKDINTALVARVDVNTTTWEGLFHFLLFWVLLRSFFIQLTRFSSSAVYFVQLFYCWPLFFFYFWYSFFLLLFQNIRFECCSDLTLGCFNDTAKMLRK